MIGFYVCELATSQLGQVASVRCSHPSLGKAGVATEIIQESGFEENLPQPTSVTICLPPQTLKPLILHPSKFFKNILDNRP